MLYKLNFASKEVLVAQETFSDRLRQAMSDRDVRQSDVIRASEMLGKKLGKSQMSQYVSGKTIPRRDVQSCSPYFGGRCYLAARR